MMPPVLYHSTPNDGTDGGFRLNEPDILKCGIFKCGNDHSKLKNPLILSIAFETAVFADSIFSLNFARMLSMTEPTVERAPFNFVEKDDLMLSSFPPVNVFAVDMSEFIVSLMPVNVADTIPFMPPPFSL